MMKVWKSNLKNHLKVGFFRATVESVLLYGAECWTMTGKMRNRLDGTYTRMLRAVLGVSWKEHKTNKVLMDVSRAVGHDFTQMNAYFLAMNSKRCNPFHPTF